MATRPNDAHRPSRQKIIDELKAVSVLKPREVESALAEGRRLEQDLFTVKVMEADEAFFLLLAANEEENKENWRDRESMSNEKRQRPALKKAKSRRKECHAYALKLHQDLMLIPSCTQHDMKEKKRLAKRFESHHLWLSELERGMVQVLLAAEVAAYDARREQQKR